MPPSTRGSRGFSAAIASPASLAISAKRAQSGSSSKSQCDLLLGSFQSITASIIAPPPSLDRPHAIRPGSSLPAADVDLLLRVVDDVEAGAAQHASAQARFGTHQLVGSPA